ncbi:GGDEF domain-containing protein [Kinneretia aquatilis]|uniref:GGDEF domain-containing protein n=1 Tax=Kinneretia aquatilis TaxID=2070761 RepID=UPI00149507D5|nr:GGDEF domain-containing protein [Paucibacter aquatile]WIV98212.1 GGDEF domain-containing protein [Paucibacter aquatile]
MNLGGGPTDALTLLAATVLVFAVASLFWWVMAQGARLAPRASFGLALVNAMLAASLTLHALRGEAPHWLSFWASDVLSIGALAVLRAVVPTLVRGRLAWRSALVLLVPAALLLAQLPYSGDMRNETRVVFGSLGALALMSALDAWRALRQRVSVAMSLLLSGPLFLISVLLVGRLIESLVLPGNNTDILGSGDFNIAWLWSMLAMNLVLNTTMAFLILAKLIRRIQRLTRHDPLTDVLNRRALSEAIDTEHARLQRGKPYALVMIDMDRFKQLNDSLGHAAGDAALQRLVEVLKPCVREVDALGRLGGEEFCVLLPLTDIAGAALVAERMRLNLEESEFLWQGQSWPLTASFGIAEAEPGDISADAVLSRADRAMYRAKAQGRNVVQALDA